MGKVSSPAPSGYDSYEYEYINRLLTESDFDLSIDALCKCFRNPSARNRFVELKYGGREMPLRILGVLYKNSVWTARTATYTPTSNLISCLRIDEPCIVDLNKHCVDAYHSQVTQDKKNLSLEEGMTLLEVLYEKYKDEDVRNFIDKERRTGRVGYSKIIDGDKYNIYFRFYVVEGRCNVSIMITCPAIHKIAVREEDELNKERQRIEEERKRMIEEIKRKEEEEKRRAEINYRNDLSKLL